MGYALTPAFGIKTPDTEQPMATLAADLATFAQTVETALGVGLPRSGLPRTFSTPEALAAANPAYPGEVVLITGEGGQSYTWAAVAVSTFEWTPAARITCATEYRNRLSVLYFSDTRIMRAAGLWSFFDFGLNQPFTILEGSWGSF